MDEKRERASAANRDIRYFRIQQMYRELQSYRLDPAFIEETLCLFFTSGPAVIYLALKEEPLKVHYPHLDLDKRWVEMLVKKVQTKQFRAKKTTEDFNKNQLHLKLK